METPVLSLYELNGLVRGVLSNTFTERFWMRAETSDVRTNQSGHCYLEFIEKDENNRNIIARARGSIWSNVYRLLRAYFESETGQMFTSGLKVLVQVSVEFHELYGYSLNVHNIDPSYTLGDQARRRAAIIRQLEEEGVLTLNKELELPPVANRIAVISSPTAAGYEDFCNQLDNNADGFVFYARLFPAVMQGGRTEESIISALDRIYDHVDKFDAVVIIRGGGATSDLSSFDSYLLAANCAQFPLPVITGIGHERDDTVVDLVAHTRAKTPTAVAEYLIRRMQYTASELADIQDSIISSVQEIVLENKTNLDSLFARFSYITKDMTRDRMNTLLHYSEKLKNLSRIQLTENITAYEMIRRRFSFVLKDNTREQRNLLSKYSERLKNAPSKQIQEEKHILNSIGQYLDLVSPDNILKKGYTLTLKGLKIIKSSQEVQKGDRLITRFHDGEIDVKAE
ncbi:MAG TPA: exodeoxyribonuclease VII large subunit [Dysgonomonas sp.]|nr:exodeoxyribonuclease VII large subunit [Dysgonomonas sp.]